MRTSRRMFLAGTASVATASVATPSFAQSGAQDALATAFASPPDSAKPRVWWHWMNGNITREGIAKDLAWMKRVGIGGAQAFDVSLTTPQIVEHRLAYMTPEWKEAFGYAARRADALDLELAISTSPGWSQTGGPWVEPKDAMKKIVWSEVVVSGGTRFNDVLPAPPTTSGPFQSQRRINHELLVSIQPTLEEFYEDIAVLAYPLSHSSLPPPRAASVNGEAIDAAVLDADIESGVPYPQADGEQAAHVRYDYAAPQTVRSAVVFVEALLTSTRARLEASNDGRSWRAVAETELRTVPSTLSFEPVRARHFRIVFVAPQGGGGFGGVMAGMAPGVDMRAVFPQRPGAGHPPRLVQFELSAEARVNDFEAKAAYVIPDDFFALDEGVGPDIEGLQHDQILDVTAHFSDDRLDWTPPAGEWKVVRIGCSLTGRKNHPATDEGRGLEVDKYDAEAVETYIRTYLDMYRDATGPSLLGRRGVRALLHDSTEAERSNWTPRLFEQFQTLRGYDMRPWLATLVGVIVGSRARSDAFLFDLRHTLSQLHASEHYGTIARVAHEAGLIVYGEADEATRVSLGDDLDLRSHADIPMSAFWTYGAEGPRPTFRADGRGAASIAHLQGKSVVACESLTSRGQPWSQGPADLQPMIDSIFLTGVNRPVIHTSPHQPLDQGPGMSLNVFGQFFTRHETWAEMAGAWVSYISRNSFLLQQGRNVADVAYFYGQEGPVGAQATGGYFTDVPQNNAYDFVNATAILSMLSVENGELVSPGGARYKLLYLNEKAAHMTLPVLRKLHELTRSGAVIVGEAPQSAPSMNDDPAMFAQLAGEMWSGEPVTQVGLGRVIAGRDVEAALARIGVAADFAHNAPDNADLAFVHREVSDGHLYFVSNRTAEPRQVEARFRVAGKAAQIWRAETGAIDPISYRQDGAHCIVPLDLAAHESVFIVFRQAGPGALNVELPAPRHIGDINGAWNVSFERGRGAPRSVQLQALASLSEHSDSGVKYFSGVSTYTNTFTLGRGEEAVWLDLGNVGDVAEIRVNGRMAGTVWRAPYRLDISRFVRAGRNRLEIRVANLWVNRLIGDQQPDAERIAFASIGTFTANAPLRPSGLLGPVTLWAR